MTAPAPFALLTSADKEGKTNIMAVSWWTYLSNHPVKIGACLSNKGYSGGNIREGGEFAICVVDEQLRRLGASVRFVVRAEARIRHPSLA